MDTGIPKQKPNYAFIDGQNLYQSIQEQNWRLDYRKFRVYLKEKYKVEKPIFLLATYLKTRIFIPNYRKLVSY